jgi:AraC family transcriptional regulator, regulatory protein of adaptative response / methylated-DNA-[protein]-cysteine methyltransferase
MFKNRWSAAVSARYAALMKTLPPLREMRRAYQRSDSAYDGIFFLGVRTTGIFCKPSCRARKPRPENVVFFAAAHDALNAGFRPCKRCRPLESGGAVPSWAERLLSEIDLDPARRLRDSDLRRRGLEPARVRRFFRKRFGITFQAFARARRMGTAFKQVRTRRGVDRVASENGYGSPSGFREAFVRTFGVPPGRSETARCVFIDWLDSPLGPLLAGATDEGVCLLEFTEQNELEGQFAALRKRFGPALVPGRNDHLRKLKAELAAYFAGELRDFTVPLVYDGSPFQRRVWDELRRIPYGRTCSYEELARRAGSPAAQRAVGQANGLNRIAIVIPCHRVINKGGKLGGYGGGLWRKKFLLELEQTGVS